jgi:hypothetical protein
MLSDPDKGLQARKRFAGLPETALAKEKRLTKAEPLQLTMRRKIIAASKRALRDAEAVPRRC